MVCGEIGEEKSSFDACLNIWELNLYWIGTWWTMKNWKSVPMGHDGKGQPRRDNGLKKVTIFEKKEAKCKGNSIRSKSWQENNSNRRLIPEQFCLPLFMFISFETMSVCIVLCHIPDIRLDIWKLCDDLNQKLATVTSMPNTIFNVEWIQSKRQDEHILSEREKQEPQWRRFNRWREQKKIQSV